MPKECFQAIANNSTTRVKAHIKDKPDACPLSNVTQSLKFNNMSNYVRRATCLWRQSLCLR